MKVIKSLQAYLCRLFQKLFETETYEYVFCFKHDDFVTYINKKIPGTLDYRKCFPVALTEVKPPHRIFFNLECIVNNHQRNNDCWDNLSDEMKDNIIINFLIKNINHEHHHKAILYAPEISLALKKNSYLLPVIERTAMENIVKKMDSIIVVSRQ